MAITPVFICGAECKVASADIGRVGDLLEHWDTVSTAVDVETTIVDTLGGGASWKFTGTGAALSRNPNGNTGYSVMVARLRFYVPASSTTGLVLIADATFANLAAVDFEHVSGSVGNVRLTVDGGTFTTAYSNVSEAAWHTLDVWVSCTGGTLQIKIKLDGDTEQTLSVSQASANLVSVFIGDGAGVGGAGVNCYIDNVLLSGTSGDYPVGDGKVIGYVPTTTSGTHNQTAGDLKNNSASNITNGDSSGGLVDEVPANVTDYVAQTVLRTTTYYEVPYNTASETGVPTGVEQIVSFFMASAASGSHKSQLYDGTSAADAYATTGFSNTGISNRTKCWAAAPSTGAWTNAKLVAARLRWGFSGDVTPNPRLSSTILEADFAVVSAAIVDPMGMSGFFGA